MPQNGELIEVKTILVPNHHIEEKTSDRINYWLNQGWSLHSIHFYPANNMFTVFFTKEKGSNDHK